MNKDIRWKQRFINFEKAFNHPAEAVARGHYDALAQAGLIQMFEVAFELAWKTLKDKLEFEGQSTNSPREVIKAAFQSGYLGDGAAWIEALDNRNLPAHTYDQKKSDEVRDLILSRYFPLIKALYVRLKKEIAG